ncbi:M24 family metallopeptidase [Roseovarius arcticus]|uniref:M24 family metallopeptidase n=1 Tax=Roseovarius arcticus TaxID=2547404 RepID=UPI001FE6A033|nr:M24 family metallopeptidase [Roseovarius arcticus]
MRSTLTGRLAAQPDPEIMEAESKLSALRMNKTSDNVAIIEQTLVRILFEEDADDLASTPIMATGDVLSLDFGARSKGICSDMTRTVYLDQFSDEGRAAYDTVLRANVAGLAVARAGVTAHEIDDAVISVLDASPYADRIRTKTGHGLDREGHDAPYIMRGNDMVLPTGTVDTNEPGLYELWNFGIRIDDDVQITEGGYDTLTHSPNELMVLAC